MELAVDNLDSGIWFTQVGEPLAHSREGFADCISSYRLTLLAVLSISEGEDEQDGDFVFLRSDRTEGRGLVDGLTEGDPVFKYFGLSFRVLGSVGTGGDLERSAEISRELTSGGR